MDTTQPLQLLGGISPQQFMQQYWQKKPLLVRQAIAVFTAPVGRAELFELAKREEVESRLVRQTPTGWQMTNGPFTRRTLPALGQREWTLLVQGMDSLDGAVHPLLQQFRFVPDARLDDVMVSYASDGGGVGPHFDSYDVFLLQAHGQRRWRIGAQHDLTLQENVPLKVLANFAPEEEFVLEPGDMLYLPPRYAHDGVAVGECMTYSIGFRAPKDGELAHELLLRLADAVADGMDDGMDDEADDKVSTTLYTDSSQTAVDAPGAVPAALQAFARNAVAQALQDPLALARVLGEYLTEPKANVWFDGAEPPAKLHCVALARNTRMVYDEHYVFINGEAYRAAGDDAVLMHRLANQRSLDQADLARASAQALELLQAWCEDGWAIAQDAP